MVAIFNGFLKGRGNFLQSALCFVGDELMRHGVQKLWLVTAVCIEVLLGVVQYHMCYFAVVGVEDIH